MRITSLAKLALVALALAIAPHEAGAAITRQIEAQATQMIQQGRAREAYALLRRHHTPANANAQQWFILGIAAYRSGDMGGAEWAFRNVLARDPNSQRAKLELARVLQQKGDNPQAERLFRDVRSQNPPAQVVANIDRFLSMMQNRNATGHAWRARATIGAGYDSNVNQATRSRQVTLFGLPFTLSRDARQRGDGFAFFKGEFDHIYRFNPNFAWATNLGFGARKQFSVNDYDSFSFNAATGPVLQPGDRTTIMLPIFANILRYENSKLPGSRRFYSNEYGVAPQIRYALTSMVSLNLTTVFGRKHYFEQSAREANVYRAAPGVDLRTPSAGTFSASLTAGREIARQSVYSNRSRGVALGWQYAFAKNFVVALNGAYERIQYDAQEIFFARIRNDDKWTASLDAIYQSEMLGGDILFSFAHTWNNSNIDLYRYTRDMVSVGYRKTF